MKMDILVEVAISQEVNQPIPGVRNLGMASREDTEPDPAVD
jgi:hypothetical protein